MNTKAPWSRENPSTVSPMPRPPRALPGLKQERGDAPLQSISSPKPSKPATNDDDALGAQMRGSLLTTQRYSSHPSFRRRLEAESIARPAKPTPSRRSSTPPRTTPRMSSAGQSKRDMGFWFSNSCARW